MNSVNVPSGTAYIKFSVITHLLANALCPRTGTDEDDPDYALTHHKINDRLSRAVELGDLRVKDPLTLAPHPYPVGAALREAVVLVNDVRQYAARHGLPVIAQDSKRLG